MTEQGQEFQRWTAKRKAAVVLEALQKQTTGVEACRKYGIKQSELEEWANRFLESGESGLRSNPQDEFAGHEAKIKELQARVRELVLERDIWKKKTEPDARENRS